MKIEIKKLYLMEKQDLKELALNKIFQDKFNEVILDEEVSKKIERLHNNNLHKFNIPTYRKDNK